MDRETLTAESEEKYLKRFNINHKKRLQAAMPY